MKTMSSIVVALDGPTKVGKSYLMATMKEEALFYEDSMLRRAAGVSVLGVSKNDGKNIQAFVESGCFNAITTVSAGNGFRAAALYVMLLELQGETKTCFTPNDYDPLREMLATKGMVDVLQTDANIGKRVSKISQMAGAQSLCGAIFCDFVKEAYHTNDPNLVIADARDPIGHMKRNNLIGSGSGLILPDSILPIYLDSPDHVAASRMEGDYESNLATVRERRLLDSSREELPATMPPKLWDDLHEWYTEQFYMPSIPDGIAVPYYFNNHEEVDRSNIQYLASFVAIAAHDQGLRVYHNNNSSVA